MPGEKEPRKTHDALGDRTWTRQNSRNLTKPGDGHLFAQFVPAAQLRQMADRGARQQLAVLGRRSGGNDAQNRQREDPQRLRLQRWVPRQWESTDLDLLDQRDRDATTKGAERQNNVTGRHRGAQQNYRAHEISTSEPSTQITNLDDRLAYLTESLGAESLDPTKVRTEAVRALEVKVDRARQARDGVGPRPASAWEISRDGQVQSRNGRDGHALRHRDGPRERNVRSLSAPYLGGRR